MRQDGLFGEQAEPCKNLGVGLAEALLYMVARPVALRAMGLHVASGLMRDAAEFLQQGRPCSSARSAA